MIRFIDRNSGQIREEKVFGEKAIAFITKEGWWHRFFLVLVAKLPLFSALYGLWQKAPWTKSKIKNFIDSYQVDHSEFEKRVDEFASFNDFFIRKLKVEARPIAASDAVIPADGRYRFFENFSQAPGIVVKGQKFSLETLLQDEELADRYREGSVVLGRLCPVDYHRFHFPCDGIPASSKLINGYWFSVNPAALKKNIHILSQNKRVYCLLETERLGTVLLMEVGATNVGSIIQTYEPGRPACRGDEKGYFSFGASALVILFEPGVIKFSDDLLGHDLEVYCRMGESLGVRKRNYS